MRLAIMQPYFLPYIGYFQLMASVDTFVIYDNIKYTKKGWINRNRMLLNGSDVMFTLPLRKGSDSEFVRERFLADDFNASKLLGQISGAYRKAPEFAKVIPLVERIVRYPERNLFGFLHNSVLQVCNHLRIHPRIVVSSSIEIDHELRGQDKVLAICRALGATHYVNAIGGTELYSKAVFQERSMQLQFIESLPFEYGQFGNAFVPWLSIVDVLMFNALEKVMDCVAANVRMR